MTSGALPAGVTLSATGALSGIPTAGGSFAFTVTATDATVAGSGGPYTASRAYSLTVAAPSVTLAPTSLPAGASAVAYSQALVASGGTAPYSYAVTAGALPAGVTLSASGTLAGTPTASGSFAFSVTATDSSGGSGPYAATRSYTLVIAAPTPPVATDTSLTVAYGASATPVPLLISGPPATSVAVASGPAHGSAVASGLSITYAPAAGYAGADSFTYTATNPGGTSAAATVTISVTPPPAPVSADRSVTTAYGTAASIDLSGAITGVRTTIAIGSAATHGTTSVSGEVVTYTPAAGYYGQDSFTYGASGPGGASAPATVTITVAAPVIAIAPATLPAGQQGVAYTAVLSASGGAAPYRFAVTAGALPAGLDLSTAGQLAGTPTQSGTFAVTITVTDSSSGATPATAAQSYTLLVAAPAPPIATGTAVTVTSPAGGTRPVDIVLSTLVTGEWTSIDAANAPAHGTVTFAATPGGGVGGRPLVIATYTPTIGYRGPDSFGFAANGPGGRSAPATVAITVLGSVPVAPTLTASTGQNVPVTIDLTAQARGAPFTAAAIVSVGPSGAATASLIEGGTADARTYRLQVTPEPRYSGTIVVTYTLSNAVGASAAATATVTVAARADPAADPTVSGLVGAQAEATRSFAATQLGNFARRNESLHGGGGGSAGRPFGVRITNALGIFGNVGGYQPSGVDRETALKMEHATEVAGAESLYGSDGLIRTGLMGGGLAGNGLADVAARNVGPTQDRAASGSGSGEASSGTTGGSNATAGSGGERAIGSVAIWSGGAVTVGSRDATTGRVHLDVTSGGLSAGSDVKLSDSLTIGIGGGYGNQRTRIGNGAARLDGDNWVGALYGSLAPVAGAFVDGVIGYGEVGFDSRRRAPNGAVGVGHRDGTMRFGSLAAGLDRQGQNGMISAYGRMEYLSATLDGYRETGAGLYDLAYGRRELDSLSSVLGGRGALYRPIDFGILTPRIRFEWRHEYRGQGSQLLDYADLGGLTRVVEGDRWLRDEYSLELGVGLETDTGWTFGLDFGGRLGSDSQVGTARATVAKKF
ncbi:autotransporter domain-containing protein [Sphingomonas sp. PB2P19]|uniref:Ig-like domain-containing protein n=1 Tax=Sphingomonas rhamnosi TaxID=3096156 RepID=UPI002FC75341